MTIQSIPILNWTRGEHTRDLYAALPDGFYHIFAIHRAGYELWTHTTDRTSSYLGWFQTEAEAQAAAKIHVGDGE